MLLNDHLDVISIDSPRLEYIWEVGRHDFFDGVTSANNVRRSGDTGYYIGAGVGCWGRVRLAAPRLDGARQVGRHDVFEGVTLANDGSHWVPRAAGVRGLVLLRLLNPYPPSTLMLFQPHPPPP